MNELRNFWTYCISKRICAGSLPIEKKAKKRNPRSGNRLNEKAASLSNMSTEVWMSMLDTLYSSPKTAMGCGLMLMMSGFEWEVIESLKWSDIKFQDDTAFVTYIRDELSGAKHDFSRDMFYDAAVYLRDYHSQIMSGYDNNAVESSYVISVLESGKKITKKALSEEARKLMLTSGIKKDFYSTGGKADVSASLIGNTYRALLRSKCGLKYDEDTFRFLTGQMLSSSTYTSYESHTSPEARERMRVIMRPLSRPRSIGKRHTVSHENGMTRHNFRPDNTAECVRVTVSLTLQPGEKLEIYSKHGLHGTVKTAEN